MVVCSKYEIGSAVFIKQSLSYTSDVSYTSTQFQLCTVCLSVDGKYLTLASVYCSPLCKTTSIDFDLRFQHLSRSWVIGDFNAKHLIWGLCIITTRGRELATGLEWRTYEAFANGEPTYWPTDVHKKPNVINFFVTYSYSSAMSSSNNSGLELRPWPCMLDTCDVPHYHDCTHTG